MESRLGGFWGRGPGREAAESIVEPVLIDPVEGGRGPKALNLWFRLKVEASVLGADEELD